MQCVGCEFENMPGVEQCGRCGAALRIAAMAMDINPPRASAGKRWLRRHCDFRRTALAVRETYRSMRSDSAGWTAERLYLFPPGALRLKLLVPGWPNFSLGEVTTGWIALALYVLLLLASIITAGTLAGGLFLGLTFAVHAVSAFAVLVRYGGPGVARSRIAVSVLLLLAFVEYLPLLWLISRVATPLAIQTAYPPFNPGDVVLLNPSAYALAKPQVGDIVYYRMGEGTGNHFILQAGNMIDRIIAGPLSEVRWQNDTLFVDDKVSARQPLNPQALPKKISLKVPPDCYLIYPSGLGFEPSRVDDWRPVVFVKRNEIFGKVYFRTQPLSRFGGIQ